MTVRRRSHELYVLKADGSIGQVIPVVAEEDPMVLAAGEAQRLGAKPQSSRRGPARDPAHRRAEKPQILEVGFWQIC